MIRSSGKASKLALLLAIPLAVTLSGCGNMIDRVAERLPAQWPAVRN